MKHCREIYHKSCTSKCFHSNCWVKFLFTSVKNIPTSGDIFCVHSPFNFLATFPQVFMKCHVSVLMEIGSELMWSLGLTVFSARPGVIVKERDKGQFEIVLMHILKPRPRSLILFSLRWLFNSPGYKETTMYYWFYKALCAVSRPPWQTTGTLLSTEPPINDIICWVQ